MKFRRILFGILLGFTIFSLFNLFIDVPFSNMFSSLAIIGGVVLILVLFVDIHQTEAEIIPGPGMSIIIYWVMSYFSITAGFSSVYLELVRQNPNNFVGIMDGISAIYFSIGTFATVGLGDIYPISSAAKFLVMSEIFVAVIVLPITIGTSVAWIINHKVKQQAKQSVHELDKSKQNHLLRIK
ncbi:MAG: ion channel [Syntrophomonas sp.]|nr:ion channel [Syntrophomonas sp.]